MKVVFSLVLAGFLGCVLVGRSSPPPRPGPASVPIGPGELLAEPDSSSLDLRIRALEAQLQGLRTEVEASRAR